MYLKVRPDIREQNLPMKMYICIYIYIQYVYIRIVYVCTHIFTLIHTLDGVVALWIYQPTKCNSLWDYFLTATRSVTYYFVKKQFDWSLTKYSNVTSLFALTNLISLGPIVLILTKGLRVHDLTLSIIGVSSMMLQNFTRGLALREWMYYTSKYDL